MLKNKFLLLFALYETVQPILMLKLLCKMERLLGKMVFFIFLLLLWQKPKFFDESPSFYIDSKMIKTMIKTIMTGYKPSFKEYSTQPWEPDAVYCTISSGMIHHWTVFLFFVCIFKTNWFLTFLTKHWALRDN